MAYYKGFSIIFQNILDTFLSITKVRALLIPLSVAFSIGNSRQFLLLRTDILQKTVVKCPCCDFALITIGTLVIMVALIGIGALIDKNTFEGGGGGGALIPKGVLI